MTVFAYWFDRNKELNYPFLGTRVIRGSRFLMIFTIQVNSYIGTTIVVSDMDAITCTPSSSCFQGIQVNKNILSEKVGGI